MSRPLRIELPNAWYHVMNRGGGHREIFTHENHRKIFLACLEEATALFNIEIHAYCLMNNHYHLLVYTPNANLSRAMRHINGVYTQRFNRSKKTDGPLFRGRYKAKLIDEDCYLLLVSRYIHLNPTEANLVSKPAKFQWSSYLAYLDDQKKPSWLKTELIKNRLAATKCLKHIKNYQDYVENYELDELAIFVSQKYTSPIIGSDKFKEKVLKFVDKNKQISCATDYNRARPVPSIKKIMKKTIDFFQVTQKELTKSTRGQLNQAKLICVYICRKKYGYSLAEIADAFKPISRNTVGTTVQKCEKLLTEVKDMRQKMFAICEQIS